MKTKKLYNNKNKTNKNKKNFLNKIKKNTKKRQRKIYKGGYIFNLKNNPKTTNFTNDKETESLFPETKKNFIVQNPMNPMNPMKKDKYISDFGVDGPTVEDDIKKVKDYKQIYEKEVEDYEKIYGDNEHDNPFYYDKCQKDIVEQENYKYNNFSNNNDIYFNEIKNKYDYETSYDNKNEEKSKIKPINFDDNKFIKFREILLKIFKRNFYRILELFHIELYYSLYFALIEMDSKNEKNVLILFKSFDQYVSAIEEKCFKIDNFSEMSFFLSFYKSFYLQWEKLFHEKNEVKNIIDTFSYSIKCININNSIYNYKSFNIDQNLKGGNLNFLNKLFYKKGNEEINESNTIYDIEEKNESNTIYDIFEIPNKKNELKNYFSENKKRIINKIKEIIKNNDSLKVIVFCYIENKKKNIKKNNNETEKLEVLDGDFINVIQKFKNNINKEYGNFLNDFYNNIFSNNEPDYTELTNFLLEKEKTIKNYNNTDDEKLNELNDLIKKSINKIQT